MNINGSRGGGEVLRSLRTMALPVMLLAALSLAACGDSASDKCKDECDGLEQEIEACRAARDAIK